MATPLNTSTGRAEVSESETTATQNQTATTKPCSPLPRLAYTMRETAVTATAQLILGLLVSPQLPAEQRGLSVPQLFPDNAITTANQKGIESILLQNL